MAKATKKAPKVRQTQMFEEDDDFLAIDQHALDKEWVEQPRLFFKYAEKLADAKEELDSLKGQLDVLRAEHDFSIREDPEKYELEKITEKAIETTISVQEDVQHKEKQIRGAKHKVDVLQAAVTALDHRKRALENLVSLHGQSYFAEPRAPDGASREHSEEIKKRAARKAKKRRFEDDDD